MEKKKLARFSVSRIFFNKIRPNENLTYKKEETDSKLILVAKQLKLTKLNNIKKKEKI